MNLLLGKHKSDTRRSGINHTARIFWMEVRQKPYRRFEFSSSCFKEIDRTQGSNRRHEHTLTATQRRKDIMDKDRKSALVFLPLFKSCVLWSPRALDVRRWANVQQSWEEGNAYHVVYRQCILPDVQSYWKESKLGGWCRCTVQHSLLSSRFTKLFTMARCTQWAALFKKLNF